MQTFATGEKTVFLKWTHGVPTVVGIGDLAAGDYVTVNVRADSQRLARHDQGHARRDRRRPRPDRDPPSKPLYLFRGTFVSTADGKVTIDVKGGNRHALKLLIGQSAQQTFSTGAGDRVPPLGAPDPDRDRRRPKLKAGDRIVIRVRADRGSSLAEVEATPARRVADREPKAQEPSQNAQA